VKKLLGEYSDHCERIHYDILTAYPANPKLRDEVWRIFDHRLETMELWLEEFGLLGYDEFVAILHTVNRWEGQSHHDPLLSFLRKPDMKQINCDIWLLQQAIKTYLSRIAEYSQH
jgi:hypothetical protein